LQLLVHAEHFEIAIQKLQGLGWIIVRSANQQFIELRGSSERSPTLPLYIQSHLFNHSQAEIEIHRAGKRQRIVGKMGLLGNSVPPIIYYMNAIAYFLPSDHYILSNIPRLLALLKLF
jgi:hypothetical protein